MPLLRKGVLIPVQGVDFSKPATFIDDRSGFPQNMSFSKNEIRKRAGKTIYGTDQVSDAFPITGMGRLELNSGIKHIVRGSQTAMERFNTVTDTWDSIAASAFTGSDDDPYSFATITEDGLLIVTNGVDNIKKWTGSGNLADLGGSPPLAKYCTYLSPYLLIAHLIEAGDINPWKVRWPDTNAPENWTTGNSGEALLSDEPSPIQNIAKLNEFAAVYKQESLYLGRKVDTADVFLFEPAWTGIGLSGPRAFAEAEGYHYFMGANDFYRWNGLRPESIGAPLRDDVFSRINRDKLGRCFALHVQAQTEIWFFVVITGYNWPTEVWKYNYRTGFWYFDTCNECSSAIKWARVNTQSWDDDPGTWDSAQDVWDSGASISNYEDVIISDANGYSYKIDYAKTDDARTVAGVTSDAAVYSYFVTKQFTGDTLEFNKRWLQLDVWARGPGKLFIDYSVNGGSSWVNIPYTSSQAYIELDSETRKYEVYFDVIADVISFRFRNNESGETFILRNFYPYYLAREQIMTRR